MIQKSSPHRKKLTSLQPDFRGFQRSLISLARYIRGTVEPFNYCNDAHYRGLSRSAHPRNNRKGN